MVLVATVVQLAVIVTVVVPPAVAEAGLILSATSSPSVVAVAAELVPELVVESSMVASVPNLTSAPFVAFAAQVVVEAKAAA